MAKYIITKVNTQYNTQIQLKKAKITYSGKLALQDILIKDHKKDTLIYVAALQSSLQSFSSALQGDLNFGTIQLEKPYFNLKNHKGEKQSNLDVFIASFSSSDTTTTTGNFKMATKKIALQQGRFSLIDQNKTSATILDFTAINADILDFCVAGPLVDMDIKNLSMHTGLGVDIEHLDTYFSYTKQAMDFLNIQLKTPQSSLQGNIGFTYKREDFTDFLNKVSLHGSIKNSRVSLAEVNAFYDIFGTHKIVELTTDISGTLNALSFSSLEMNTLKTSILGDFLFKNMFAKPEDFLMYGAITNITSNYTSLQGLLPRILGNTMPSVLKKLGNFTTYGTTRVTTDRIDSKLNLATDLGSIRSELTLRNISHIDNASYNGTVILNGFHVGKLLSNTSLDKVSLDVAVQGKGFSAAFLDTNIKGHIHALGFHGYNYTDIAVHGKLTPDLFDGIVVCNDPNIAFNFDGILDTSKAINTCVFNAFVHHADLHALHFTKDKTAIFKGAIGVQMQGTTLEDSFGSINFTNTSYQNRKSTYHFNNFDLESYFLPNKERIITLNAPEVIKGKLQGKFLFKELGKIIENSIGSVYTNYTAYKVLPGQYLDFDFKMDNKIIAAFFPQIYLPKQTFLKGKIISDKQDLKLVFKSPEIHIDSLALEKINLKIDSKNALFNTYLAVDKIRSSYYSVSDFNLINTTLNDTLFFRTEFSAVEKPTDRYNLNFYHTVDTLKRSVIGLKKSDVTFKGNTWYFNKNNNKQNKVTFTKALDTLYIDPVILEHKNERMILSGDIINKQLQALQLQFKDVSLDKVTPDIPELSLKGVLNAAVAVAKNTTDYVPIANFNIADFYINNKRYDSFSFHALGDTSFRNYTIDASLFKEQKMPLSLQGALYFPEKESATIQANLRAKDFDIALFNPLAKGVFDNIQGRISTDILIKGPLYNPDLLADVYFKDTTFNVPYLNVNLALAPDAVVHLYNQTLDFDNLSLIDTKYNTKALLQGVITHKAFSSWYLDLNLAAPKDRFLVLDTKDDGTALYYGTGFITGNAQIKGLVEQINIKVDATTQRGTLFKIPIREDIGIGDTSYISFIDKNTTTTTPNYTLDTVEGIELAFNLDVTPDAEVEVVIDAKTGSSLKGKGAGTLLMDINTKGKFNMWGDFITFSGDYKFKYGNIIDKKFSVKPGGSITWDGDPLNANLNVEAMYSLRANPGILLDNISFNKKIATDVGIKLSGKLLDFNPDFSIAFPGSNSIMNSELQYRLEDSEKRELQALSLLSQGTFINQASLTTQAITGNLLETASSVINQIFDDKEAKLSVGFTYDQGDRNPELDFETQDRLGVTVSTQITDRVLINGKIGVPVGGIAKTVVAGDVEVEILLNQEGTLSAKIFNKENEVQQFLGETGYTQGAGLFYQVEFDTFKELLRKILKKK